ncbi:hypothetical protein D9M71_619510 [compost metagenome]
MDRHVRQRLQGRLERLHQPWIAHVGHVGHVDRPGKTTAQHRHRIVGRRDIHSPQRPALARGPGQRLGLIVQVQPVQAGGMHLGIDSGGRKQALAQLWIKILGPMRQRGNRRAVAPWIERRNDAAARPGRFLANARPVQQHHALHLGREIECRQQADYPTTDDHHLLLPGHVQIQPLNRQRRKERPKRKLSDPSNPWWSGRP